MIEGGGRWDTPLPGGAVFGRAAATTTATKKQKNRECEGDLKVIVVSFIQFVDLHVFSCVDTIEIVNHSPNYIFLAFNVQCSVVYRGGQRDLQ